MIETIRLNMDVTLQGKDCIRHTTSGISSGKVAGCKGIARDSTV